MADAKKTTPEKKPAPAFPKRLLTAWKKEAEKAAANKTVTAYKIMYEPGAALALAEAIATGLVPSAALWPFGEIAIDAAPTSVAVGMLRAMPDWLNHAQALRLIGVLAHNALLEDPAALDAIGADDAPLAREVAAMLRASAGVAPSASVPQDARQALARDWCASAGLEATVVVDGRAARVRNAGPNAPDALRQTREYVERIFGRDELVPLLAEAHRARIREITARPSGYALYPAEIPYLFASEALSPAECAEFQPTYALLARVAEKWGADELHAFCSAAQRHNRRDAYMVINAAAVLAIGREPASAERFEPFLNLADMTNQASAPPAAVYAALARTDPAWLRAFVMKTVFAEDAYPGTFAGPMGIALLTLVDAEEARRQRALHAANLDFSRIPGVDINASGAV